MTPKIVKPIRLEKELIATIQREADRRGVTFSELVRNTLWLEFGLVRSVRTHPLGGKLDDELRRLSRGSKHGT